MEQIDISKVIENFMHPTVYTGVKPVLIVAEELVTEINLGKITEAVWIHINSSEEFSYVSKFAVSGKIILGKYYQKSEMEPFHGRVALTTYENLKNTVLHQDILKQIQELESKRFNLLQEIHKEFENLLDLYLSGKEVYLFEKKDSNLLDAILPNEDLNLFEKNNANWDEELFSDLNIHLPYKLVSVTDNSKKPHLYLKKTKTSKIKKHENLENFYGYFVGSQAELSGLILKNESYLARIKSLKSDAKKIIKKIEWLSLDDLPIQELNNKLPKHPFEDYFHYVKKEDVRKVDVSDELVETLKKIILKHMPENNTPLGIEYILIDKLLYLFHMIISRDEALLALEMCDIVYEPPGILLGYGGERKTPPKYLVPISHVAYAYKQFESFMSVCQNFKE